MGLPGLPPLGRVNPAIDFYRQIRDENGVDRPSPLARVHPLATPSASTTCQSRGPCNASSPPRAPPLLSPPFLHPNPRPPRPPARRLSPPVHLCGPSATSSLLPPTRSARMGALHAPDAYARACRWIRPTSMSPLVPCTGVGHSTGAEHDTRDPPGLLYISCVVLSRSPLAALSRVLAMQMLQQ
jgi:hypothetical protein